MGFRFKNGENGMAKKYEHLRRKAIELRNKGMALGEICERLSLGKTTVYYWIKDIRIGRTENQKLAQKKAAAATRQKHKKLRQAAYDKAYKEAPKLFEDSRFRDFVVCYLCEGDKRNRNRIMLANSDASMIRMAFHFIRKLAGDESRIRFTLQRHADQDESDLIAYWSELLGIDESRIKVTRKSNSGGLTGRTFRSRYGVFSIWLSDTYVRSGMEAWMDYLKERWEAF